MRKSAEYAKRYFNKPITVVEVGVWKGKNAKDLLDNLDIKTLYLVDPYTEFDDPDSNVYTLDEILQAEKEAKERLKNYKNIIWVRKPSLECDIQADYVYLDGNHSYEEVLADMRHWWPKTKILAGHDFRKSKPGVIRAFREFGEEIKSKGLTERDDWWFV